MGKVIAPLAKGTVPARTIFDRRFVLECCERFHLHWRNVRLELTADNWSEFVRTFETAIATWRANGSPREHPHLELGRYLMDSAEIVHPDIVEVELCENLYKSMRDTHGADAEFWDEDAFVHFHYRDLRFEMSIEDFLGFSKTMAEARERLRPMLFRPLAVLFEHLNEHNILYVVLRNWEALPDNVQVGPHSDLDLLVHPAHVGQLDRLWATQRTRPEPYRVQRRVPVLAPDGRQSFILADIRTTDDGYMPEAFSHALLARRVPQHMFHVLPPREHFLSLLYHAVVHKGVMSADYARRLTELAAAAGIPFPPARINDLGHHLALLREHGVEPVAPDDVSVLPKLPFVDPPETAISSRLLDVHEGRPYMSRVHLLDGFVRKQTTFDLAAREHALLTRLAGPHFPRALATTAGDGWTSCDLELVDGTALAEADLTHEEMRELMRDCIAILEELAGADIVHRDIKPDNILVRDGRPVLIDFGWAIAPDLPHTTPAGLGDAGRAPEGFCDTYAMGIALAEVCSPFPDLLPLCDAMSRRDPAERVTDPSALRELLDSPPDEAAIAAAVTRFEPAPPAPPAPPEEHVTRLHVLAFAEELIAAPELIETYAAAFDGRDPVDLTAYAPDAEAEGIAGRLEAVLAPYDDELKVVLVPVPRSDSTDRRLANASAALLSGAPAEGPFATLPRVGPDEAAALRTFVLGESAEPPLVSIVIPVFNRLELTKGCLESIRATAGEIRHEVIVFDNGSSDGTAAYLRAEQAAGRLRCAINGDNAGFARACNLGAGLARGELLVFLNNDTIAQPGWLDALVETLDDPTVGLAGSRLLYPDGTIQHAGIVWNARGELDHIHRGVAADTPAVLVARDFAAVTGACVMMRRELFRELGGFDESFRMYVEDVDLCLRVWEAGLRVTYCPSSVLVHLENASVSDIDWRNTHVRAGWELLNARWAGRWPQPVRRFAWPQKLPGSPRHTAVLAFADDLTAHPELVAAWTRTFTADEAKLVVYGPGAEPGTLAASLDAFLRELGLDLRSVDALAVASPEPEAPPPLLAAVAAVLASGRPAGAAAALPYADDASLERLRELVAGDALVA